MPRKYNRLQVGSKVLCRYFNTPENKFYGDTWEGEVIKIRFDDRENKIITVRNQYGIRDMRRKEIKRVLS